MINHSDRSIDRLVSTCSSQRGNRLYIGKRFLSGLISSYDRSSYVNEFFGFVKKRNRMKDRIGLNDFDTKG